MKKKIIIIVIVVIVVIVLLASLGGDGSSDNETTTPDTTEETSTEEQEMTDTAETEETENVAQIPENITTTEEAREYMDSCSWEFNYTDFLRYEEDYIGKDYAFTARVSQVLNDGSIIVYDDENGDGYYSDNQIAVLDKRSFDTTKILEDDMITIYGRYVGSATFTLAINDNTKTVPEFQMFLCDLEGVDSKLTDEESSGMDYSSYEDIILDCTAGYDQSICYYALYDMDNDGIKELIVSYGNEGESIYWMNEVYTMDIYGQISSVGDFGGDVTIYEADEGYGIYAEFINNAGQTITWITKDGDQLNSQTISSLSAEDMDNYFYSDRQIEWCVVSDLSGL
jgi:hypothetical protein